MTGTPAGIFITTETVRAKNLAATLVLHEYVPVLESYRMSLVALAWILRFLRL